LVAAVVGALVLVAGGALTLGRIDLLGGIAFHASASPAPALDTPLLPVTPYAAVPLPAAVAAALGPALADLALGMLTG
jgi:hypothetical protein